MHVVEANLSDIPSLCALLEILFSQEVEFAPSFEKQKKGLELIIANEQIGKIFVLKEDSHVIGMVSLLFSISTALGGKVAWLEDMIIHPDYRGRSCGSQLIDYAIVSARALACQRITLLSDADNLAAHHFYKQHGFKSSSMYPFKLLL
ncbi:MAG: GNAT family N-acetyltransferase [Sulfurospirillaceae bacterium]|nr:GNAT family N-acetyltransferase [Sulfurospirillaceae bacterium]MDD2827224.1 GNAT family N-acetyltransferase [Sulfurospirillaceae bacterium]